MKVLVFQGPWKLVVEERPDPTPAGSEVLLRIVATGICGSDLHGFTGENGRRHPGQVMGHETVATVVDDPSGSFAEGAVVTVNPVVGCETCERCEQGDWQLCPDRQVIGVTPEVSSAFAELLVAPRRNVVGFAAGGPEGAVEVGALVEPLAVGYHAARRAQIGAGDRVLVIGGGPIGQAAALGAVRMGCSEVVVLEPDEGRRALCGELQLLALDPGPAAPSLSELVIARLGGRPSVVLDAVGTSATMTTALELSALGSRIVLVGMNSPQLELPAYAVSTHERSILGSFCYNRDEFAETATWAATNSELLRKMTDGRVALHQAPETFTRLAQGELRASKVLVRFDEKGQP